MLWAGWIAYDQASFIIAVVVVTFLVGSILKGLTTLGLGLVVVPVLATVLDPVTAVLTLFLAKAVSDALMAAETRHDRIPALWGRIGCFLGVGLLSVVAGTVFLASLPKRVLFFVIGVLVVGFVVMHLLGRNVELQLRHQRPFALLAGFVSGMGQGMSGMSGSMLTMYAYSLNLAPRQFVFVTSLLYTMINIGQFAAILYFGLYDATRLMLAAWRYLPCWSVHLPALPSATAFPRTPFGLPSWL